MLVATLVLAGVGFAFLVLALTTGSVIWAWTCIGVCLVGAVLLLVGLLSGRGLQGGGSPGADNHLDESA